MYRLKSRHWKLPIRLATCIIGCNAWFLVSPPDYMCGSPPSNWSSMYTMQTLGSGPNYSPVFLVYGDFGYDNAQSMPRIQAEVDAGGIDAILHVGDLAYNIFEDEGRKGDNFMNMIQGVATQVPYMTLPGNHEYYQYVSVKFAWIIILHSLACNPSLHAFL